MSNDSMMSADINVDNDDTRVVGSKQVENNGGAGGGGGGGGGVVNWENAREKLAILTHPLYEQLLSAHVGYVLEDSDAGGSTGEDRRAAGSVAARGG